MELKNKKWWLLPIGAAGVAAGVLVALNPTIESQTQSESADPRLRTRRYNASLEDVRQALVETIPTLRKYGAAWRLSGFEADAEAVTIRAEVPVLVFTDDLIVTLRAKDGATELDASSRTRVRGKSDFGENRRHLLQLLAVLDAKFETAKSE